MTVTVKLCIAVLVGVPLSATITRNEFVVFACFTNGRHVNTPLLVFIAALVGPVGRLNVGVCAGTLVTQIIVLTEQ